MSTIGLVLPDASPCRTTKVPVSKTLNIAKSKFNVSNELSVEHVPYAFYFGFGVLTSCTTGKIPISPSRVRPGSGSSSQPKVSTSRWGRLVDQKLLINTGRPIWFLVADWVWLTWILIVPLPAQLCLGWWEFGRSGLAAWQSGETQESKSTKTLVYHQIGHPVLDKPA